MSHWEIKQAMIMATRLFFGSIFLGCKLRRTSFVIVLKYCERYQLVIAGVNICCRFIVFANHIRRNNYQTDKWTLKYITFDTGYSSTFLEYILKTWNVSKISSSHVEGLIIAVSLNIARCKIARVSETT